MRPVTDAFKATVTSTHAMVARARLVPPGQEGTNPGPLDSNGEPLYPLAIVDGVVNFDATAEIRATLNLTVAADWPSNVFDMLNPYGAADVFIERGVVYGSGTREWVSLGYYRTDDLDQDDAPSGTIELQLSDRMAGIIDARLETPRQYDSAVTIRFVVEDLVQEVYPGATVTITGFDPDVALGSDRVVERDRYPFLLEIAKAHGCTVYFDYDGSFVMAPVPDLATAKAVASISHGAHGVLVGLSRKLTREGVFNAVVANGEQAGDGEPAHGVAYDLNPNSPTYWNGPFGKVPKFFSSSFLLNNEQCVDAAQAMLTRSIGLPYSVNFGMVPNAALEPLDVVDVKFSDRVGTERHALEKLSIPLVAARAMTANTRVQPRRV